MQKYELVTNATNAGANWQLIHANSDYATTLLKSVLNNNNTLKHFESTMNLFKLSIKSSSNLENDSNY